MKASLLLLCILLPFSAMAMHKKSHKEKEKIALDADDIVLLGNTIISNDVGAVDILISRQNIDLNAIEIKDKFTNRPLHLACLNPYTIQIAKLLLEKGIDINGQDFLGDTALHWAVRQNNQDAIKLLVKNKINTTILNKAGKNASYWSKKYKSMELKPSKL